MESSDYHHSIVQKIKDRKNNKIFRKMKEAEDEAFDLFYSQYRIFRKKYYDDSMFLERFDKKQLYLISNIGFMLEFNENIYPKIQRELILKSGLPLSILGLAVSAGGIVSTITDTILSEYTGGLVLSGASIAMISMYFGERENPALIKLKGYTSFRENRLNETIIDRCEIRYQQDLIYNKDKAKDKKIVSKNKTNPEHKL